MLAVMRDETQPCKTPGRLHVPFQARPAQKLGASLAPKYLRVSASPIQERS